MKIAFMCSSGSPTGIVPEDIYGRGVGGAELSLLSLAETFAARGHEVWIYNNPRRREIYHGVHYELACEFNNDFDVIIIFRTPWLWAQELDCTKIFWSCDQYTIGDYDIDIFPFVDHTVCISPYHLDYHLNQYNVEEEKISYIDLGVRLQDYEKDVAKVRGRCIYCSVPDRGLELLCYTWPFIKMQVPDASLVITADYRLWGGSRPRDEHHRAMWGELEDMDVQYLGRIPRDQLCEEQGKAEVMTFPCTYEELFCISAAECQVAGAVPVTTTFGALPTTVEAGVKIQYSPYSSDFLDAFIRETVGLLQNDQRRHSLQEKAKATRTRFNWERIAEEWEQLIERIGE